MSQKVISIFKVNRDASPTSRGFYYQYLLTVQKWIQNFIVDNNAELCPEVDEDIKEVGKELIFTQVKSYTKNFSLNSQEIKDSLFHFYLHFVEYSTELQKVAFVFYTNTGISKSEKLLTEWVHDPSLSNADLHDKCTNRVRVLLKKEFKRIVNERKSWKLSVEENELLKEAHSDAVVSLDDNSNFSRFLKSINWVFVNNDPNLALEKTEKEVLALLQNQKLNGAPPFLLFNVLLSEVYRTCCLPEKNLRVLTLDKLKELLARTYKEIRIEIDSRLVALLGTSSYQVLNEIAELRSITEANSKEIELLKQQVTNPTSIPKELKIVRQQGDVLGREMEVNEIHNIFNSATVIVINGYGGLGKSALARAYCNTYWDSYDHFIWLDSQNGFKAELAHSKELQLGLRLHFESQLTTDERFDLVSNQLKEIASKNGLIVIDNLDDSTFKELKDIPKILNGNWRIIITTRGRIPDFQSINVEPLSFENSLKLVDKYVKREESDVVLKSFFEIVGFNTLMIELCAKLVRNSLDLNFEKITQYLLKDELTADSLKINIPSGDFENTQLYTHLAKTFNISGLALNERHLLEQFSFLPDHFSIRDFIDCYGSDFYEKNKVSVTNQVNELHKKGWLTREDDIIKMHSLIQAVVRTEPKNVFSLMLFVNYLCHRLHEANAAYSDYRNKYIQFAKSIVKNIPESQRTPLEQPLLLMENNLLEAERQLGKNDEVFTELLKLVIRAEQKLGEDELTLGVIYHNMATSYFEASNFESALEYLNKAIDLFKKDEAKNYWYLINSYDGLTLFKITTGDISNVVPLLKKTAQLRKKYVSVNDPLFSIQLNNSSFLYTQLGMFDEAIESLKLAIIIYKNPNTKPKNDFLLASYYSSVSYNYCLKFDYKSALKYELNCASLIEGLNLKRHPSLKQSYMMLHIISRELGSAEKSALYLQKASEVILAS